MRTARASRVAPTWSCATRLLPAGTAAAGHPVPTGRAQPGTSRCGARLCRHPHCHAVGTAWWPGRRHPRHRHLHRGRRPHHGPAGGPAHRPTRPPQTCRRNSSDAAWAAGMPTCTPAARASSIRRTDGAVPVAAQAVPHAGTARIDGGARQTVRLHQGQAGHAGILAPLSTIRADESEWPDLEQVGYGAAPGVARGHQHIAHVLGQSEGDRIRADHLPSVRAGLHHGPVGDIGRRWAHGDPSPASAEPRHALPCLAPRRNPWPAGSPG
jgi:hypothetical protein